MGNVIISTASVPAGFCFEGWPASWPVLVSLLSANLGGTLASINLGNTEPTPENRDKPWFRINADSTPDKVYQYYNGLWVARHPIPAASGMVVMYQGAEASIETLDGGESGAVTPTTGPMWEKVAELDGKFPLGPGTLPSGTVVAQGNSGGEETHVLTTAEMPSHTHGWSGPATRSEERGDGANVVWSGTASTATDATGGGLAHNNLPPYYSIFFIKRSSRIFYRA